LNYIREQPILLFERRVARNVEFGIDIRPLWATQG